MSPNKKTATVRMEEGYMRVSVTYSDSKYKSNICGYITELEKRFKIFPEVIYKKVNQDKFSCSIEFSGDEYICSRTCGDFIEELLTLLEIKECQKD